MDEASKQRGLRIRTLTEKAMDEFANRVIAYKKKLQQAWLSVEEEVESTLTCGNDTLVLRKAEQSICFKYGEYRMVCRDYVTYLEATRTEESFRLLEENKENDDRCDKIVNQILGQLDIRRDIVRVEVDNRSIRSGGSRGSRYSAKSTSSSLAARAKAEAAKARIAFTEKEAELRKKQAILQEEQAMVAATAQRKQEELEADLGLLRDKKLYAEAAAEVEVFETVSEWRGSESRHDSLTSRHMENPMDRTKDYVLNHSTHSDILSEGNEPRNVFRPNAIPFVPLHISDIIAPAMNEAAAPLQHITEQSTSKEYNMGTEFGRFLVKKELLMSRFTKFQDDPIVYTVWKNTFKNITQELCVTHLEEIDLLLKWLGPESARQALSLRTANSHDPAGGLNKIWDRLDERYGAPELIENILRKKVANFPRITVKEPKKLYDLSDVLSEIESVKDNEQYATLFAYYDSSIGVNPVVSKLPTHLQNKWTERARKYKKSHEVTFPPFTFFVAFIREISTSMNDPSFDYDVSTVTFKTSKEEPTPRQTRTISTRKTEVQPKENPDCPIHPTSSNHSLSSCREFQKMPIDDRRQLLKDKRICFRCCNSDKHQIKDCKVSIRCNECESVKHTTALHIFKPKAKNFEKKDSVPESPNGGERSSTRTDINCMCAQICGDASLSKSCAKVVKVCVYPKGRPDEKLKLYALIDDQSNRTLGSPEFFEGFKDTCTFQEIRYSLSSLAGNITTTGRRADGFVIESLDGTTTYDLPSLMECIEIPDNREEIPTPDVAIRYPHLKDIAMDIPELDENAGILLLIGRDLPEAHHVHDQKVGPTGSPYGQRLSLGWVIIGETCLGDVHQPVASVNVMKTFIHKDGRQSIFPACENKFILKDKPISEETDIFLRTREDDKLGLSVEDRVFLDIMDKDFVKDEDGYWVAPLPFRSPGEQLPNNRVVALKRASILDSSLKRNPNKKEHFVTFMKKVLESGAAEVAPPATKDVWYLPIFGVYHPRKPDRIRGVFDSSATYGGLSLNSVLLSGPNLTNSLLGILLRFRKDTYAITADIEQMFYSFLVRNDHRDFLRFFWYRENDPGQKLIEYRMRAHVFGNSPSPAVATYGLRKSVEKADDDVREFVNTDFYVDDALTSRPSAAEAVGIMKRTQAVLKTANLRLHKIASNSRDVMRAFEEEDLEKDLKSLNFEEDLLPTHQSLGLAWDLDTDSFKFNINLLEKSYTRRGLLSTVNSIFDPLGFVAPLTVQGKIIIRQISPGTDWDEPLDPDLVVKWKSWSGSLLSLEKVSIPRMYVPQSLSKAHEPELHIFSDASEKAVSAVAYLRIREEDNTKAVGFVMGKAKLAPVLGHTIPRLELCAALLAAETGETIMETLKIPFKTVKYYTDSKVVLGYINNKTRRFYNYVSNRVERILHLSRADQWNYVHTKANPADLGSRGCSSLGQLNAWLTGPDILQRVNEESPGDYPLVSPDDDNEVRKVVNVCKTTITESFAETFKLFSSWQRLVRVFALFKGAARRFRSKKNLDVKSPDVNQHSIQELDKATEQFIIKLDQKCSFCEEEKCLSDGKPVNRGSSIGSLSPYLDSQGIMRVGGRLGLGCLPAEETNPVIISGKTHAATLIVRHFHEKFEHQGRLLTEGAVRNNGFWIVGAKRLISNVIHHCVTCRKLRGNTEHQIMANLPVDRLTPGPPFTSVGVDAFGPWSVVSRRTRGGMAHSKRWAILFTCMTTRAVHIEVVEEMSSSSFINALRRFVALRGNVKEFRSDRGTNFVGATEDLNINVINVEGGPVPAYLRDSGVTWKFNAPHSSHMGGVWERMIGIARKVLDAMLLGVTAKNLTHEVLVTVMAEVSAIMNSRPVSPISSDPDCAAILSPATLLNQKIQGGSMVSFDLDEKDIYKKHWKMVQVLSNIFWKRWREGYLQTLQSRRKWKTDRPCVKNGDVVLLKDKCLPRNEWAVGVVINSIESESDGKVRKAEVCVCKDGKRTTYTRPITDMVILID